MSKNKFMKRLLALGIATVSAVSVFGMAACGPDSGEGGGGGNDPTPLAKPTGVDIVGKNVTWNQVEHADGYIVYEKLKTATGDPTEYTVVGATNCQYTIDDSLFAANSVYEYYVVATSNSEDYSNSPASDKKEYTVPVTKVTLTLNLHGGTLAGYEAPYEVDKGTVIDNPGTPVREGYVFDGWFDGETDSSAVHDWTKGVLTSATVHAVWHEKSVYDLIAEASNNIIAENFNGKTQADLQVYGGSLGGTPGIYVVDEQSGQSRYDVSAGKLVLGGADKLDKNAYAYADFGHVKGAVEGYFEFQHNEEASGDGNSVNFYDGGSKVLEMIANGQNDNAKFVFKLNGVADPSAPTVSAKKDTLFKVYFKLDLSDGGKLTLKINETTVYNEAPTGITSVSGMQFATSNGGRRNLTIDNIAVSADAATPAEYAAVKVAALNAKYNSTTLVDSDLGNIAGEILTADTGLLATHIGNVNNASSYAEVDDAYKAAVEAIDAQVAVNALANATNLVGDGYVGRGEYTNQASELAAAKVQAAAKLAELGQNPSLAQIKAKYLEAKAILDAVETDSEANVATITVTVKGVKSDDSSQVEIGTFTVKSGASIALADILKEIEVPFGYFYGGLYEEAALSTPITDSFAGKSTSLTEDTDEVYAKLTKTTLLDVGAVLESYDGLTVDGSNTALNKSGSDYLKAFDTDVAAFSLNCAKNVKITALTGKYPDATDPAKTFTHILLPSGSNDSGNPYTLTAKQNITVAIYWTGYSSSYQTSKFGYKIGENPAVEDEASFTPTANVAYRSEPITLNAEDVLNFYNAAGNRMCVFAIEYVVNA